jgi:hypothetical protein
MESTGTKGRIQISQSTGNLLRTAGKGHWLTRREDSIVAKGKGVLDTFWLKCELKAASSHTQSEHSDDMDQSGENKRDISEKHQRLVDWIVDLLADHIRKCMHKRAGKKSSKVPLSYASGKGTTPLDEVAEVIAMPKFDARMSEKGDYRDIEIPDHVMEQLREYVSTVSFLYRDNAFHNFEHACHVTMSGKLLSTGLALFVVRRVVSCRAALSLTRLIACVFVCLPFHVAFDDCDSQWTSS